MSAARIEQAMARLNSALGRIDAARGELATAPPSTAPDQGSSARVMAVVNGHEKLREEVADTIGQIDALIEDREG